MSRLHGLLWLALLTLAPLQTAWADATHQAPPMLLAQEYGADIDVTRYWVSEKFDGVRAQWDGRALRFRGGSIVPAPSWFTANFPPVPLDGELWVAHGQFDALSATVRRLQPVDAEWRQVRYLIFELPGAAGSFSERIRQMLSIATLAGVPWLQVIEQTRVNNHADLMRRLDTVVSAGGEGLMLHHAEAPYVTGRSDALLKLKPWQDAEAIVVGHVPGKGKYLGMTGSLRMEMPEASVFTSAAVSPTRCAASRPRSARASPIATSS